MTSVARTVETIAAAADKIGLPELAKRSGVPYTTLADWRAKAFRPLVVQTLEKLSVVAESLQAEGSER